MNFIKVWFKHWYNDHYQDKSHIWWQTVKEFPMGQKEQAREFGKELRAKGYDVAGHIGSDSSVLNPLPTEKTIYVSVRANNDGTDIKELKQPATPFRQMLFKRPMTSRIKWVMASLVTIVIGYTFSTMASGGTDTISTLANALYPIAYLAGGIGLIGLGILGIDG